MPAPGTLGCARGVWLRPRRTRGPLPRRRSCAIWSWPTSSAPSRSSQFIPAGVRRRLLRVTGAEQRAAVEQVREERRPEQRREEEAREGGEPDPERQRHERAVKQTGRRRGTPPTDGEE